MAELTRLGVSVYRSRVLEVWGNHRMGMPLRHLARISESELAAIRQQAAAIRFDS